jgi:hypothetical protein
LSEAGDILLLLKKMEWNSVYFVQRMSLETPTFDKKGRKIFTHKLKGI